VLLLQAVVDLVECHLAYYERLSGFLIKPFRKRTLYVLKHMIRYSEHSQKLPANALMSVTESFCDCRGGMHPLMLHAQTLYGCWRMASGNFNKEEKVLQQAVADAAAALGTEHADTLAQLSSLQFSIGEKTGLRRHCPLFACVCR
jgi:hypothetical protein